MVSKEKHPAIQAARNLQLFGYLAVFITLIVAAIVRCIYISRNADNLDSEAKKLDLSFSFTRVEFFNETTSFNSGIFALIASIPLVWNAPYKIPTYI